MPSGWAITPGNTQTESRGGVGGRPVGAIRSSQTRLESLSFEESSEPDDIHIPVKELGEQSGESSERQHGRSTSRASYPEEKSEQANNRLSNSL
jgi:hypothetical protein